MEKVYREAFAEVLEILRNSNQNIIKKTPKKFVEFLMNNKDEEYRVNIDFSNENWENNIKQETQAIIALIYRDYIVSSEERNKLLSEEKAEQIRVEQELREKYNPDNIFKNRHIQEEQAIETHTELVEYKEQRWYQKLFIKILRLLKK